MNRQLCVAIVALLALAVTPSRGAEPKVQRDLAYAEPKHALQTLDVYSPAEGNDHPIAVWIHGGGWRKGDKAGVQRKPQVLVERGFVFASINYRFVPEVSMKEMMADVAKAIAWVRQHAPEFGGDPNRIVVMGHSAGAHLAALVCTDDSFLKAAGVPLSSIKGCVPIDVSVYDIPKRLKDGGSVPPATFQEIFGEADESHRDLSPVTHVVGGKSIPAFLILHVADRPDTRAQSDWFAKVLTDAGVSAKTVAAEGKTHGTISSDLGLPDDKPTAALYEFLDAVVK